MVVIPSLKALMNLNWAKAIENKRVGQIFVDKYEQFTKKMVWEGRKFETHPPTITPATHLQDDAITSPFINNCAEIWIWGKEHKICNTFKINYNFNFSSMEKKKKCVRILCDTVQKNNISYLSLNKPVVVRRNRKFCLSLNEFCKV